MRKLKHHLENVKKKENKYPPQSHHSNPTLVIFVHFIYFLHPDNFTVSYALILQSMALSL